MYVGDQYLLLPLSPFAPVANFSLSILPSFPTIPLSPSPSPPLKVSKYLSYNLFRLVVKSLLQLVRSVPWKTSSCHLENWNVACWSSACKKFWEKLENPVKQE